MRLPPATRAVLRPSRLAISAIVGAAIATSIVIATLPFHFAAVGLAMLSVGGWDVDRVYGVGLRRDPRATREIKLTGDRIIVVRSGDDRLVAGHVRDAS